MITQINSKSLLDFDLLCATFHHQPFSICGKKIEFEDAGGTLFFDIWYMRFNHKIEHNFNDTFCYFLSFL
ncbi:DNA cytosine methyltransferase [uncultured Helicobacter sp.]|uniref:DNA cytosine methyltransferase n=1 Tax=uncultured Helicobacter sp. TaxID=175537 RepID=UPI00261C9896|nr:DNA cytosine methyltransferase [uncultured Helicobacter sp.]